MLTSQQTRSVISAAEAKAESMRVPVNIAVLDAAARAQIAALRRPSGSRAL